MLLSVTVSLIELVHMYNIKYNHDNTIKKKKKKFQLLHSCMSPGQRMSSNTSLIDNSKTGLIFILGSTLLMEGDVEMERVTERQQGRETGMPPWSQTQMDKMRGEHKRS